jgi:hypothetical protein
MMKAGPFKKQNAERVRARGFKRNRGLGGIAMAAEAAGSVAGGQAREGPRDQEYLRSQWS